MTEAEDDDALRSKLDQVRNASSGRRRQEFEALPESPEAWLHALRLKSERRRVEQSLGMPPTCATCGSPEGKWGWVRVFPDLSQDGGVRRCETCRPSLRQRLLAAGLTPQQLQWSLLDPHPQLAEVAGLLRELADRRFKVDDALPPRWVVIHGQNGVGKDTLISGLAAYCLERDLVSSARVVRAQDALDALRRAEFSEEQDASDLERALLSPYFLGISDLPREQVSPWVRSRIEWIFDQRYEAEKVTAVSSNPHPRMVGKRPVFTDEEGRPLVLTPQMIEESYGPAVASRLGARVAEWIEVRGVDLRRIG